MCTDQEVAVSDAPLSSHTALLDDCKHSEGFTSCGVLQAGRRKREESEVEVM